MEQTEKVLNETGQDGEQFVKTFLKAENIRRGFSFYKYELIIYDIK